MRDSGSETSHSGGISTTAWRTDGSNGDILNKSGVKSCTSVNFSEDDSKIFFGVGIFESTFTTLLPRAIWMEAI